MMHREHIEGTSYDEVLEDLGKQIDKEQERKDMRTIRAKPNKTIVGFNVADSDDESDVSQTPPISIPNTTRASNPVVSPTISKSLEEMKVYKSKIDGWSSSQEKSPDSGVDKKSPNPSPKQGSPLENVAPRRPRTNSRGKGLIKSPPSSSQALVDLKSQTIEKSLPSSQNTNTTQSTQLSTSQKDTQIQSTPQKGQKGGSQRPPQTVKKPQTKAERRAIQEAQRAAKAARLGNPQQNQKSAGPATQTSTTSNTNKSQQQQPQQQQQQQTKGQTNVVVIGDHNKTTNTKITSKSVKGTTQYDDSSKKKKSWYRITTSFIFTFNSLRSSKECFLYN
eukprot:TRINITY_DN3413_c0_g1_i1.p1 TRINITY_DN3413_c0_g1~~TRINITY_DN3413_c0_g1_i1.p1  ORF type:complete len:334 (-),score=86.36 TRINITY_DN3413_c0_g1_i1:236-1237(-)